MPPKLERIDDGHRPHNAPHHDLDADDSHHDPDHDDPDEHEYEHDHDAHHSHDACNHTDDAGY